MAGSRISISGPGHFRSCYFSSNSRAQLAFSTKQIFKDARRDHEALVVSLAARKRRQVDKVRMHRWLCVFWQ